MKKVMYQFAYEIDEIAHPYIAKNHDGVLTGFKNLPVRDYNMLEWVDSVTGLPGDFIPHTAWDTSLRVTAELFDPRLTGEARRKNKPNNAPYGKKGMQFNRKARGLI